jgi:FMN-dependent NADH-azoreductase
MKLLHIDSSILGDNSASRQLSREVVDAWKPPTQASKWSTATWRPMPSATSPPPPWWLPAPRRLRDAAQAFEAKLSAETLEEFLAADAVVIGAPMYNFTVPTQLKAWIDRVAVAGKTFRYTEAGPEGLCGDKKVVLVSTAGGLHAGQPTGAGHEDF